MNAAFPRHADRLRHSQREILRVNQLFVVLLAAHAAVALLLAFWHRTYAEALIIGFPAALVPIHLLRSQPFAFSSRAAVAASLMIFSGLFIDQSHGLTEMHFHVFSAMAFLLAFRDWRTIVVAAATIAVQHVTFAILQFVGTPVFIYTSGLNPIVLTLIHAAFVVFEAAILVPLAMSGARDWAKADELDEFAGSLAWDGALEASDGGLSVVEGGGSGSLASTLRPLSLRLSGASDRSKELLAIVEQVELSAGTGANQSGKAALSIQDTADLAARLDASIKEQRDHLDAMRSALEAQFESIDKMQRSSLEQEEAATASKSVAEKVQVNAQAAKRSSELGLKRGKEAQEHTAEASRLLAERIDSLSKSVEALGTRAKDVQSILSTINGIAEQTNLLALNAAIEAARAGEHGRGFAIVADEVRKLAASAAEATSQVGKVIADVSAGVSSSVAGATSIRSEAEKTIEQLNAEVEAVCAELAQILAASDAVSEAALSSTREADRLRELAEQNSRSASESQARGEEVTHCSGALEAMVADQVSLAQRCDANTRDLKELLEELAALSVETTASCERARTAVNGQFEFIAGLAEVVDSAATREAA